MSDVIYREQAIDKMQMFIDSLDKEATAYKSLSVAFDRCIIELRRLPSAQPERKRGMWIECEEDWLVWCRCSECNYPVSAHYNYCPRCGARMDGENE